MAKTKERKQFLFDCFITAMEGGIGYWAASAKYRWSKPKGNVEDKNFEEDHDNFNAIVIDAEGEDAFEKSVINQAVIVKGINMIIKGKVRISSDIQKNITNASLENDCSLLDAGDCDCIVQVGLFEEIVFG